MAAKLRFRPGKIVVFLLCLAPCFVLAWDFLPGHQDRLTADPVNYVTHFTGDWTLRLLMATLAITPLRRLLQQPWLIQYRRMLGLFAFFYGCLHLTTWVVLDKVLSLQALGTLTAGNLLHEMWMDTLKRRFITAGMIALGLMLPLAITSTRGWIRRLGKRWQKLHRLIYFSAAAAVIHYWWLVKKDTTEPKIYAGILAALMLVRVFYWMRKPRPQARAARPAPAAATAEGN